MTVTIHIPAASDDEVSAGLRRLTKALMDNGLGDPDYGGGLFGGEHGYGVPYENEVFMMHPFCWCGRGDCAWCRECECEVVKDPQAEYGWKVEGPPCARCKEEDADGEVDYAPHFLHKPTGTTVRWYKYIGRSMEVDLKGDDWGRILTECLASLTLPWQEPSWP